MHALLARQLKRFFSDNPPEVPGWSAFIAAVDAAYTAADNERDMIGRSMELMSAELRERYGLLFQQLREKLQIESELIQANDQLRAVVTQLETAQMQLLQADKMASIGQLAAGVAHEINNPIGYVHSNLASLQDYLNDMMRLLHFCNQQQGEWPPHLREQLQRMQADMDFEYLVSDIPVLMQQTNEGIARVRKIVQDLREFSHVNSGEMTVCDIHQGIHTTLNMVRNEYKDKAQIVYELGTIPQVKCNLGQLNQVFLNLIINACHAIQEQGTIHISTGRTGDKVWIRVADSGVGIAPDQLGRIFDAFYTTKPVGKGTGLGLSLSYSIIKAHNGTIEVSSTPGAGSVFTVWLPIRQRRARLRLNHATVQKQVG